jgi:hypothetical protein
MYFAFSPPKMTNKYVAGRLRLLWITDIYIVVAMQGRYQKHDKKENTRENGRDPLEYFSMLLQRSR